MRLPVLIERIKVMSNKVKIVKKFMASNPLDIEALFEELGIGYEKTYTLDTHISGEIERKSENSFVIRTNARHSDERQRFTAAHELGHYMLHRLLLGTGVDDNKAYRSDLNNGNFKNSNIKTKHETEANRFAAVVLMPSDRVREEFAKESDPRKLAREFGVSITAMEIRIRSLGL